MSRRILIRDRYADAGTDVTRIQEIKIWLERQGLPAAKDVSAGSPIIIDDDANTITVNRFVRNEQGHSVLDGDHVVTEEVTVQLKAPALPIPVGFLVQTTN